MKEKIIRLDIDKYYNNIENYTYKYAIREPQNNFNYLIF